ncbi:MAG TPA: DNA-3-methyladenine glycosylase [Candidatus Moranbacteria bacterium]|nr:DNA-3-methyladenine glycosylase [Candidatus Moranbacteria bacterium]HSA07937.1 DNA-3-methyladenine glycosylase [Candidatus Moranbacteria bacterium]
MILKRGFYNRNTLNVAKDLLGCFLIRKIGSRTIKAMITETEAYMGEDDLASHASKGRTPRTELMFGVAGRAYIYMIYGMYHCLNIVTEKKDFPAAVLIRAVKIEGIDYKKTNGPGKLCKVLKIDRKLNGKDITKKGNLYIEKPAQKISKKSIVVGRRIGIDYAKHCKEYLWRFTLSY